MAAHLLPLSVPTAPEALTLNPSPPERGTLNIPPAPLSTGREGLGVRAKLDADPKGRFSVEPITHVQAHIGADGTLRIEGLHHIVDQDMVVILATKPSPRVDASMAFDLEQYAAPVMGKAVADRLKAIRQACSSLPVLDDRSADDILGYNDLGLPE